MRRSWVSLSRNERQQFRQRAAWYYRDADFGTQHAELIVDDAMQVDIENTLVIDNVTIANRGFYYCSFWPEFYLLETCRLCSLPLV